MNGKNLIMIYGPKDDGTYVVEFRTADGEALAISIPRSEAVRSSTVRSTPTLIAVGILIAEHPPHRSERAQFRHSAPTLGA